MSRNEISAPTPAARYGRTKEAIMAKHDPQSVKQVAQRISKAKGIEADEAAKLLRSRIRANFDLVASHWPALKAQGKVNKDGNRYPPLPPALADALTTAIVKGTPVKDAIAKPRKARKAPVAVTPDPAPDAE